MKLAIVSELNLVGGSGYTTISRAVAAPFASWYCASGCLPPDEAGHD